MAHISTIQNEKLKIKCRTAEQIGQSFSVSEHKLLHGTRYIDVM